MAIDKSALLRPQLPESDVDVPGVGTVRVRGLSRLEAIGANRAQEAGGTEALYRYLLHVGLVEPALSEAEVETLMGSLTAGQVDAVATEIGVLSGLMEDSAKEAVRTFRGDPGDGVRVPAGPAAGPDGGGAAAAAE